MYGHSWVELALGVGGRWVTSAWAGLNVAIVCDGLFRYSGAQAGFQVVEERRDCFIREAVAYGSIWIRRPDALDPILRAASNCAQSASSLVSLLAVNPATVRRLSAATLQRHSPPSKTKPASPAVAALFNSAIDHALVLSNCLLLETRGQWRRSRPVGRFPTTLRPRTLLSRTWKPSPQNGLWTPFPSLCRTQRR